MELLPSPADNPFELARFLELRGLEADVLELLPRPRLSVRTPRAALLRFDLFVALRAWIDEGGGSDLEVSADGRTHTLRSRRREEELAAGGFVLVERRAPRRRPALRLVAPLAAALR